MRSANSATIALLATGNYVRADLWTITLNGGTVIRWHNLDLPLGKVSYGGNTWLKGPGIRRNSISEKTGVEVTTLQVDLIALATDLINGKPIIPFIAGHGLDGATIKLERAYAPDWPSMYGHGAGVTGTSIRFAGKVTSVDSIQGAVASFTVSSWMVLLNADMPRNLFQAACMHTLYDPGCTVNPASFSASGHFTTGVAAGSVSGPTSLTQADAYFSLGRIVMTSGANNGLSRTVKAYANASGQVTLSYPFANAIATGDTFTAFAGCDLTRGANGCTKFSNLANYKGTDFVPQPTTPLTVPASTPTSTGGGKGGER